MGAGRWHPSITSHRQKMIRQRDHDSILGPKTKRPIETIDITKSDWSNRRGKVKAARNRDNHNT